MQMVFESNFSVQVKITLQLIAFNPSEKMYVVGMDIQQKYSLTTNLI